MTSTKAIVDWGTACGRTYLEVAGVIVAVEGGPERDGTLGGGSTWTNEKIEEVVRRYAAAAAGAGSRPAGSAGDARRETRAAEMCMDVASGDIPAYKDAAGVLRTAWCHLDKGHAGPHRCGEHTWTWPAIDPRVTGHDWAVLVEIDRQIAAARARRQQILAKHGIAPTMEEVSDAP